MFTLFDLGILLPEIYARDVQRDLAKAMHGKSVKIKHWKQSKGLPTGDKLDIVCYPVDDLAGV